LVIFNNGANNERDDPTKHGCQGTGAATWQSSGQRQHSQARFQGECSLKPAEINEWARLYISDHPEIVEAAIADAKAMILSGALGKRAAKALRAKLFGKITETKHSPKPTNANSGAIANG
jgi:hypothetical protein